MTNCRFSTTADPAYACLVFVLCQQGLSKMHLISIIVNVTYRVHTD